MTRSLIAATLLLTVISCKRNTTRIAGRPTVDLPDGWVDRNPTVKGVHQFAAYPDLSAYFEVSAARRSDFADRLDLRAWAALIRDRTRQRSALANRMETDLKEGNVAGRQIYEYEITAESKSGLKVHYRMIMLTAGDWYCQVTCWTTPSHWDEAQPKFDEVVQRLK